MRVLFYRIHTLLKPKIGRIAQGSIHVLQRELTEDHKSKRFIIFNFKIREIKQSDRLYAVSKY